jgi:hypothetical protein
MSDEEAAAGHEKCTRLLALTVARKPKFLSSPLKASPCTAENVIRSTENTEIT